MLPSFINQDILTIALTHRSALNENKKLKESNERYEFLGDAVLELSSSVFLFHTLVGEPEGVLTSFRSSLVKTTTLASAARTIGLGELLYMSKGEEISGGRNNDTILADSFEALIGGLYLDQGYDVVDAYLHEHLYYLLPEIQEKNLHKDHKSQLQEYLQSHGNPIPFYSIEKEEGPDHQKIFTISVSSAGKELSKGTGRSKHEAQQDAAKNALEIFAKT